MTVTISIKRFNPEAGPDPFWQKYESQVELTDRVLDALVDIKRNQDGSLGFRKSCAHGVCGSDAMIINGTERLACKTLIKDVVTEEGATITIQPLRHMKVQRDLMIDQSDFFARYRSVKPFLVPADRTASELDEGGHASADRPREETDNRPEGREIVQSQEERNRFDDATKCILCSACFSACPVLDDNSAFLGPAAIVQGARFVFDSRDQGLAPRMDVLNDPNGVWPCQNHFQCTRVCPRGIKVTKLINLTKREIKKFS
jgi:succinate dehydrogenase / fumarate reductase iron-sulfur subunit